MTGPNFPQDSPSDRSDLTDSDAVRSLREALLDLPRQLTPEQQRAQGYLRDPVATDEPVYLHDTLSPTVLDPFNLKVHGLPYLDTARMFIHERLDRRAEEIPDFPQLVYGTVAREIEYEHHRQAQKNQASLDREIGRAHV